MADPKIKKGYAPAANEILEQFCKIRMSPIAYQILFAMVRLTWGWKDTREEGGRKKYWDGSICELARMIERDRGETSKAVSRMIAAKVLRRGKNGLGIQSDYDLWGGETGCDSQSQDRDSQSQGGVTNSHGKRDYQSRKACLPVTESVTGSHSSTVELKKEIKIKKEREDRPPHEITGLLPNGKKDTCFNRGEYADTLDHIRMGDALRTRTDLHPAGAPDYERANFMVQNRAIENYERAVMRANDPAEYWHTPEGVAERLNRGY